MILPLQSANLEVEYPWNWEQIQADAELIKNTNTNILPDLEFENKAIYTTYRGLKYECVYEANPLVGSNPDLVRLVTHKTVFLHPVALLQPYDILSQDTMQGYNVVYTTVVYNNYRVWNKARKVCTKR